jgi:hypothetical protein
MIDAPQTLETPADAGEGIPGQVKRWLLELELAGKVEDDWRKLAKESVERHRQDQDSANSDPYTGTRKRSRFNILWANTELLRPALYNSTPKPDVRRRFRDADPIGKEVARLLERALSFSVDESDFDEVMDLVVLDYVLPGRGVARVRYEPVIEEVDGGDGDKYEQKQYEYTFAEHVNWEDFRRGPGRTWPEVMWIAYRHRIPKDEGIEKFGKIFEEVNLDWAPEDDDSAGDDNKASDASVFKRAEIWEIWCKESRTIKWLAPSYDEAFLMVEQDKLQFEGFFDTPRPLLSLESSDSLIPVPEYELYKEQAEELDDVTHRIRRIISGLRIRGIYDSRIKELDEVFSEDDNAFIPSENVAALLAAMQGSSDLDKVIWMLPVDRIVVVLHELYMNREQIKQTIYEITGISDILRGATDPRETLGAQKLKAQTGSLRIQKRQGAVQRYARDLIRLMGEIVGEQFDPMTLMLMTGIELPTAEQRNGIKQAIAQAAQPQPPLQIAGPPGQPGTAGPPGPQQQGQPPPAPPKIPKKMLDMAEMPTWEEALQILRDDGRRGFRVDIETDSTIAADIDLEQQNIMELMAAIGAFTEKMGPAVAQGFISIDAAKTLALAAIRRFKLGREVEDAIESIGEEDEEGPEQQQDPAAAQAAAAAAAEAQAKQAEIQAKAQEAQAKLQIEQTKLQIEGQKVKQAEVEARDKMALDRLQGELKAAADAARMEADVSLKRMELEQNAALRREEMDNAVEIERMRQDAQRERESKQESGGEE